MDTSAAEPRIALIGIIVDDLAQTEKLNQLLHYYADCIIGRMGVPYRAKNLGIISVIVDAPSDRISALSGKLGMLEGITVKTIYAKR